MVKTNRRKNTKRKSKRGYNKRTYNKRTYNKRTYNRNKYTKKKQSAKKGGTFFMGHLPMVILGLLDLGFISYLMYDIKTPSTPSQPGTYTPSPVQQQQVVTPGQPQQQLQQQQIQQQLQQQQMQQQQQMVSKGNCKSEEFVLKKQGDDLLNNEDDKQIFTIEKTKINEFKQKIKEKTKLLQQKINQCSQREINLKEEVRQKLLKEYKEKLSTLENSVSSILKERQGRSDDLQDKERTHQLRVKEMETRLAEAQAAAAKKPVTVRASAERRRGGAAAERELYPGGTEIDQMKTEIGLLKQKIEKLEIPGTKEFEQEINAIFKDQVTRDPSLLTIKGEIETIYEDFTDIKEELTRLQELCNKSNKSKGFFSRKKDKSGESLDKELLIVKGALYAALKNGYIHESDEVDVKTDIIDVMFQGDTKRQQILGMFNSEIGKRSFPWKYCSGSWKGRCL